MYIHLKFKLEKNKKKKKNQTYIEERQLDP